MTNDLAARIAKLEAIEEIRRLKARYADVCDTVVGDAGAQAVWLTGRYTDRYRREDGVWKFAEVRLDCQTISPVEEGWVRRPFWNE